MASNDQPVSNSTRATELRGLVRQFGSLPAEDRAVLLSMLGPSQSGQMSEHDLQEQHVIVDELDVSGESSESFATSPDDTDSRPIQHMESGNPNQHRVYTGDHTPPPVARQYQEAARPIPRNSHKPRYMEYDHPQDRMPRQPYPMPVPMQPYPQYVEAIGQAPRISCFMGNNKGDTTYRQWRFEVVSLQNDGIHSEIQILEAVRRSLRGDAASVMINLGHNAGLREIVSKMDLIYGEVMSAGQMTGQFWLLNQYPGEKMANWARRADDAMAQLVLMGAVSKEGAKQMLREKFFKGLYSFNDRTSLRHRYDAGESYEDLVLGAKSLEKENPAQDEQKSHARAQIQQQQLPTTAYQNAPSYQPSQNEGKLQRQVDQLSKDMAELRTMMEAMNRRDKEKAERQFLESRNSNHGNYQSVQFGPAMEPPSYPFTTNYQNTTEIRHQSGKAKKQAFRGKCRSCDQKGHKWRDCPLNR